MFPFTRPAPDGLSFRFRKDPLIHPNLTKTYAKHLYVSPLGKRIRSIKAEDVLLDMNGASAMFVTKTLPMKSFSFLFPTTNVFLGVQAFGKQLRRR